MNFKVDKEHKIFNNIKIYEHRKVTQYSLIWLGIPSYWLHQTVQFIYCNENKKTQDLRRTAL